MEDSIDEPTTGMGPDINLINSEVHVVQDVEADLEEYTRLTRIGRFGEASKFFRETLHRHIGCFAVLSEHCNALVYQGNYGSASAVLTASIARQEASVTGPERFRASEMHFLRVLLAYVNNFAETKKYIGRLEAKSTVSHARWYRDSITATDPRKLLDVERQILLTCVRIFIMFYEHDFAAMEDLRLPWSSRPLYPGETLKLSEDYLAWFEVLLPEYPWDACIVFEGIRILRPQTCFSQDYWIMMDLVERNFPDTASNDVNLFARMILLGKLCEVALIKRWYRSDTTHDRYKLAMLRIVVNPESEQLVEMIQHILEQHSGSKDIAETRPYKNLQLLMIGHEMIREQKLRHARKAMKKLLPRLSAIEKFAASPKISDHQLSLDVMYHQYIFLEKSEWFKTMLNKIAHFVSHFGATQETLTLQSSILARSDLFSEFWFHPKRTDVVSDIIKMSLMIKSFKLSWGLPQTSDLPFGKGQSIFEDILHDIGNQERDEATWNGTSDQRAPYQVENHSTRYPGTFQPATSQMPYSSYSAPLTAPQQSAPVQPLNNPFAAIDHDSTEYGVSESSDSVPEYLSVLDYLDSAPHNAPQHARFSHVEPEERLRDREMASTATQKS